jgi:signal transduction histidine kinase/CheY-like chemotaxis protein
VATTENQDSSPGPQYPSSCLDARELLAGVEHAERIMRRVRDGNLEDLHVENPTIPQCWKVKNCKKTECPCYGGPPVRCWQVVGTHCKGEVQGEFAKKLPMCEQCSVYLEATKTPTLRLWETLLNMLHMLRIEREELIRARDEALQAERAKTAFLANMSHEIRTPLNGILGMADLLSDVVKDPEQRKMIEVIRSSGDTLLTVLDDVLDYSKIEAGHMDLEDIPFNVRELVEDVLELFCTKAADKDLDLFSDIHPDVPAFVRGDPSRIRQILSNLVGNAIKFTHKGFVHVEVSVEGTEPARRLHFAVRDTGIGIPRDRLDQIFRPFTQADSSMTRRYGGSGLGLAISSRLAELMKGTLEVESEEGKGSVFHLRIPLRVAEGEHPVPDVSGQWGDGYRVLVVDDQEANRTILSTMLRSWKLTVEEADSGETALRQWEQAHAKNRPFHLLIVDKQMPGMDGDELVSRIRALPGGKEPAILMLSSCKTPEAKISALEAGCDAYMTKPVHRHHLGRQIRKLLNVPVQRKPEPAATTVSECCAPELRGTVVLVVDDHAMNRMVVRRMLEKAGCEALEADGGPAALAILEKRADIDLILLDVQMPGMDGFETVQRIKADPRWRSIPVVALTAHALQGDREKCLEAGMDDYLSKPVRRDELLEKVDQWVTRRRNAA